MVPEVILHGSEPILSNVEWPSHGHISRKQQIEMEIQVPCSQASVQAKDASSIDSFRMQDPRTFLHGERDRQVKDRMVWENLEVPLTFALAGSLKIIRIDTLDQLYRWVN